MLVPNQNLLTGVVLKQMGLQVVFGSYGGSTVSTFRL
ncbi:hypothetical protein V2J09_020930 [Rumex salicifolius]